MMLDNLARVTPGLLGDPPTNIPCRRCRNGKVTTPTGTRDCDLCNGRGHR